MLSSGLHQRKGPFLKYYTNFSLILNQENLACLFARAPDSYQREMLVHSEDSLRAICTKITQLVNEKNTKPNQTKRGFVLQMFWLGWFSKNKWEECNTQAHKARIFKRTLSLHGKSQRFILLWLVQFDWHNKMILQVKTAFCFTKWESCLIKMRRESWRSEQWVIFLRQSHIRETFKEPSSYSWTFERRGKKRKNHRNENWLKISTNCLSGFGAIVPSAVYH